MRGKRKIKNIKNCGVKSEFLLGHKRKWLWWKIYENKISFGWRITSKKR